MKSIMQKKDGTCYLCMKLHKDYSMKQTEEHHCIFGTSGRKLSEKYGLKVYLCIAHHRAGKEAVHNDATLAAVLKEDAQKEFEKTHSREEFLKIFGRNYIIHEERKKENPEKGFRFLKENEDVNK